MIFFFNKYGGPKIQFYPWSQKFKKIGTKMATQRDKNRKKKPKIPQDLELLKQVPESSHQTVFFCWREPIY